jgi:hypothetical protein
MIWSRTGELVTVAGSLFVRWADNGVWQRWNPIEHEWDLVPHDHRPVELRILDDHHNRERNR